MLSFVLIVIFWAILPICASIIAHNKHRDIVGWFLVTLLFPPILLILLSLAPVAPKRRG